VEEPGFSVDRRHPGGGPGLHAFAGDASPTNVKAADSSDNTFYFTYDAEAGVITKATSSALLTKDDKVTFYAYVRDRAGAPVGERLRGLLTLQLLGRKPIRYSGAFTLDVRGPAGVPAYEDDVTRSFTLRPKPGKRKTKVTLPFFDLPSGDYSATASFKA
jgi:hypothetical protein